MSQTSYYQSHLDQVSRSFAFCIAQLQSPLKEWVGLSYLLFRNLDSIEDAKWNNTDDKLKAFQHYHLLFDQPTSASNWHLKLPEGLPDSEVQLMAEAPKLAQDFFQLPEFVQTSLRRSLLTMSAGMQHFSKNKILKLKSLQEVNQYCFFVAGLIGELLTDLLNHLTQDKKDDLYFSSVQFGIFLQKINLLKDQISDEKENRFLVPNRQELLISLKKDADGAIKYLTAIPLQQKEFRLFCAWSLFIGLSSLKFLENSWLNQVLEKIPRSLTTLLIGKIETLIDDNQALIQYFIELTKPLENQKATFSSGPSESSSQDWLLSLYQGRLSREDLGRLGLI